MRLIQFRLLLLTMVVGAHSAAPAAFAQDAATPATGAITSQPLLTLDFSDVPAAPAFVAMVRYTLPPGTSITSRDNTGPRVFIAESGKITVSSSESDAGFRRAADAPLSAGSSGSSTVDAVLVPGDHFQPVDAEPVDLRNDGARAAVYLDVLLFPRAPLGITPFTTMDGVVVDPLVAGVADAVPVAPVEIHLDRLDLAPGEEILLPATDGPRLFVVESGTLGLVAETGTITYSGAAGNNPGSTAGRVRTVAPGSESMLTARGSVFVQAGATGLTRNLGRTRLLLLSLTVKAAT